MRRGCGLRVERGVSKIAANPPTIRSISSIGYASRTNTTVSKPAGTQTGDLLLAIGVYLDSYGTGVSSDMAAPDASWTNDPSIPPRGAWGDRGLEVNFGIWHKPAGADEPASYTWTNSAGQTQMLMLAITGANALPMSPSSSFDQNVTFHDTSMSAIGLFTSGASLLLALFGNYDGSRPDGPPTGFTSVYGSGIIDVFQKSVTGSAGTGDITCSISAAPSYWGSMLIPVLGT